MKPRGELCGPWCVCASFVKTYDEAQDSTLGVKKRKIEEVTEAAESKPKKVKLTESTPTATTSGAGSVLSIHWFAGWPLVWKTC